MVRTSEPIPKHRSPRTPDPKQSSHSDILRTERALQPSEWHLTQGSSQLEQRLLESNVLSWQESWTETQGEATAPLVTTCGTVSTSRCISGPQLPCVRDELAG